LSGTAVLCLMLAACNKTPQADQPVAGAPLVAMQLTSAAPPPPSYAPPASALPPAPNPVAYRPAPEHWRYLTDAYDMSDAFEDTPPDYTVPYEGEDPYVWRADNGAYRVVEWLPDGARYYYYEPGADEPFLIQDPEYSYAYDNGALVAVYTLAGALVADRIAAERRGYASRYYARGHDLYRAAQQDRRRGAYAANWRNRAPMIRAQRERWQRGSQEQDGWQDWTRSHQAQQETRWAPERRHRAAYAAALASAGTAGAGATMHRRDQRAAPRIQAGGTQPAPVRAQHRPGRNSNGNRPDVAERQAEADRAHPGLLHDSTPAPQAHGAHPAMADRHAPIQPSRREQVRTHAAEPNSRGASGSQERTAPHQATTEAKRTQRHELQRAQQAQHREMQQAAKAQRSELQARVQQTQQAQHAAVLARHAHVHASAPAAPPHVQSPRPQPTQAKKPPVPIAHPQAPHPASQPRGNGNGNDGQKDGRHRH
jgi:hypothetical protein